MSWDSTYKPCLRALEAFRVPDSEESNRNNLVGLSDPSGLSDVMLTLSVPALHILSMMDGTVSCAALIEKFNTTYNQKLSEETVATMIDHLEKAHFLEGPSFEHFYQSLVDRYRKSGVRQMLHADSLGIVDDSGKLFDDMLAQETFENISKPIRGLVAPHLDYPRGAPCYARAYNLLRDQPAPDRIVILGTNHFGRSTSVVTTGNDFQTPLGTTTTDRDFIDRIEQKCGDLRQHELDHQREHSIELQVAWLQHLYGADQFEMVAVLCHDPCGSNGTASYDGQGVDLIDFSDALRETIAEDKKNTLLIAGADLSHVGENFGDNRKLEESFLQEVQDHDREALNRLEHQGSDAFVQFLQEKENYTRVCSAGCIFTLARVLPDAQALMLRYHQAVDPSTQTCVTCTAIAFT